MRRNPLPVLRQLRAREMQAARAELLSAERHLVEARRAVHAAESAIRHEMAAAASVHADDSAVQAFAKWLPVGRASVARAKALRARAEEDTLQARTVFNLARSALEAVETLIESQRVVEASETARKEQASLDEMGSRLRPPRSSRAE